jgi:hypothetical protein
MHTIKLYLSFAFLGIAIAALGATVGAFLGAIVS